MPVPDYQSLMAPVLSALSDGGDHSLAELRAVLAEQLGLTEEDLQAKIPCPFRPKAADVDGWSWGLAGSRGRMAAGLFGFSLPFR
jgi:restriction system protein